ncbi:MAG: DNA alkylation repair protein [Chthoniobacterales bacterium]
MKSKQIQLKLKALHNPEFAARSKRFFKTDKGGYAESDKFLGVPVPVLRKKAREFETTSLPELRCLLKSPWHEVRLCALLVLVRQFEKGSESKKTAVYKFYLANTPGINNWDLVDSSAYQIVGSYLLNRNKKILFKLALSDNLWERRIAIISTFRFIKEGHFEETLQISKILINDPEDLIHKAVGWMLRETGNRNIAVEKKFLRENYQRMPRTMLRYAIEKFPDADREKFLS